MLQHLTINGKRYDWDYSLKQYVYAMPPHGQITHQVTAEEMFQQIRKCMEEVIGDPSKLLQLATARANFILQYSGENPDILSRKKSITDDQGKKLDSGSFVTYRKK